MAKMFLKKGADAARVARSLQRCGMVVKQHLSDGSFVLYKKKPKRKGPGT